VQCVVEDMGLQRKLLRWLEFCNPTDTSAKTEEGTVMRKELRIGLTCLSSFALAAALWAFSPASNAQTPTAAQTAQTPAAQSVSGKIASVEKSSFTLTVASEQIATAPEQSASQSSAKTMTFQVDSNTAVDGKLKVGAKADVTYRQDGGNNIAISVRVS
jgi:Cu/Ag efflux protein CusF